jgi:hypothetical protein
LNWPLETFYIGKDARILFVDKEVKTGAHGSDIVAKLKEFGGNGKEVRAEQRGSLLDSGVEQ